MRFMVMVRATRDSEAGVMPDEKLLTEMGKFNDELVKAGIMLAGEGLQPSSKGTRVRFSGSKRTVIDGPFAETKVLIAGFWVWQVKSKDEALSEPLPRRIRDRDPSGVRSRRLRRRAHAGASQAGGASAQTDGRAREEREAIAVCVRRDAAKARAERIAADSGKGASGSDRPHGFDTRTAHANDPVV